MKSKIIISGGGTGGHIYPAIAIADALKVQNPKVSILFVGAEGKMEMDKVPEAGYSIRGLNIDGFSREMSIKNLILPFKLLKSLWNSSKIIKSFQPNIAIGVGGYASGPILKMSAYYKIPYVILEQNSYPGLTNKILSRKAEKIFVAYPNMNLFFPKEKLIWSGNPIRKDIININQETRQEAFKYFGLSYKKKTLLALGGSLGAKTINESILMGLEKLQKSGFQLIWQTGTYHYDTIKIFLKRITLKNIVIYPFIKLMHYAYLCADLVIARAGALSISELCLTGKPAILVPSPNVVGDHQTKNSIVLFKSRAAVVIPDSESKNRLINEALVLLQNNKKLSILHQNIQKFSKPNSSRIIAEETLRLI